MIDVSKSTRRWRTHIESRGTRPELSCGGNQKSELDISGSKADSINRSCRRSLCDKLSGFRSPTAHPARQGFEVQFALSDFGFEIQWNRPISDFKFLIF